MTDSKLLRYLLVITLLLTGLVITQGVIWQNYMSKELQKSKWIDIPDWQDPNSGVPVPTPQTPHDPRQANHWKNPPTPTPYRI